MYLFNYIFNTNDGLNVHCQNTILVKNTQNYFEYFIYCPYLVKFKYNNFDLRKIMFSCVWKRFERIWEIYLYYRDIVLWDYYVILGFGYHFVIVVIFLVLKTALQ